MLDAKENIIIKIRNYFDAPNNVIENICKKALESNNLSNGNIAIVEAIKWYLNSYISKNERFLEVVPEDFKLYYKSKLDREKVIIFDWEKKFSKT